MQRDDWLEMKRLEDRVELPVGELVRVEAIWDGYDGRAGVGVHLLANA